jgi:hypothetical protein
MAPKKAKAAAKPAAVPKPHHQQPWVAPGAVGVPVGLNAQVMLKHRDNVDTVLNHHMFANAGSLSPLAISTGQDPDEDSGFTHVFKIEEAVAALQKTGQYMCGINLLWHDPLFAASHNIPTMWSTVEELREFYFSSPAGFVKLPIELGVTQAQIDAKDFGLIGTWKRISCEEIIMSWFAAVAADVRAKKKDEVMRVWLTHLLTAPATFYRVDQDIAWLAEQKRENYKTNVSLSRTTVQRIFDLNNRRMAIGAKTTPSKLFEIYTANLSTSKGSEAITLSFCEKAFTIWDRALCRPIIQRAVLEQEANRGDSLFAHSTKLNTIIAKARTDDNIEFVFTLLQDYFLAGFVNKETMGSQALEGKQSGSNGKGLVDLWVFKRILKCFLIDELMPKKSIPGHCKTTIREVCHNFDTFRAKAGFANSAVLPDLTWRAGWPKSADLMFALIEDH